MKTLAKLILIAGIGLSSLGLSAQDFKVPHEIDGNKFIPEGAMVIKNILINTNTPYGIIEGVWYNKDCKSLDDYKKRWLEEGGIVSGKELFLDMDGDGIPDLSAEELSNRYDDFLQEKELEKTSM